MMARLPPPPWRWGKKAEESKEPRRLSAHCYNMAFIAATAYEQAVQLETDLLSDRRVDAETRMATLNDMVPQIYGLTKFTTQEERERLVAGLNAVRSSLSDGTIAHDAANKFTELMREALFNIIVRCEC